MVVRDLEDIAKERILAVRDPEQTIEDVAMYLKEEYFRDDKSMDKSKIYELVREDFSKKFYND